MMEWSELLRLVDELENTLGQSAKLGIDQRWEMVQLRRTLADEILKIGRLGEVTFEDAAKLADFRTEFSKMRSAMALHQASWPIVAIDRDSSVYKASLQATRDANRRFFEWIRRELASS